MSGMGDNDGEPDLFDNDFDELPDSALWELEQKALQATQQARTTATSSVRHKPTHHVSRPHMPGGPRTDRTSEPQSRSLVVKPQQDHQARANIQERWKDDSTLLYESDAPTPVDEKPGFIPQRRPGGVTRGEQRRGQHGSHPVPRPGPAVGGARHGSREAIQSISVRGMADDSNGATREDDDSMLLDDGPPSLAATPNPIPSGVLQARIEELLKEQKKLAGALENAESTILTQQGEIAIVRAQHAKDSKFYDRQVHALNSKMQEDVRGLTTTIQGLENQIQKTSTESEFLKQDLHQLQEQNRSLQRQLTERPAVAKTEGPVTTPQKDHVLFLRDGFDDDEIMAVSPVKGAKKPKASTPTSGRNRKRKAEAQSPMPPLVLRPSQPIDRHAQVADQPKSETDTKTRQPPKDVTSHRNVRFLQRILNHHVSFSGERIVEACTKFSFPSEPTQTFAHIILDSVASLSSSRLQPGVLKIFNDLLMRALKGKYFVCVPTLLDMISFIVALYPAVIDADTITFLLPTLQEAVSVNTVVRFAHSPANPKAVGKGGRTPQSLLQPLVDSTVFLELLCNLALICEPDPKLISTFWRRIMTDTTLALLHTSQLIPDTVLMLHMLSTSILKDTFGNICGNADEQTQMEHYLITRLSWLLRETPSVDEGAPVPTRGEICQLRLETMDLLTRLGISSPFSSLHPHESVSHGSHILTQHPQLLARLVRSIYDETDALYAHTPTRALHARLVNEGVRLLYHLTRLHGDTLDMAEKLAAINGGAHKHRVALTRLAFSESGTGGGGGGGGSFFFDEGGITDDTVRWATEMLEESVTPDEAEALLEAFPSWRGGGDGGAGPAFAADPDGDDDDDDPSEAMDQS